MLRTFFIVLAFLALGVGLANYQHHSRHRGQVNILGVENLDVSQVSDKSALQEVVDAAASRKFGRIEVVNGRELDFGLMMAGTKRSHKFVFKNVGQADAKIWFKKSTCKCTVGKFENAVLTPDEEIDVELEWKAESKTNEFSQSAVIGTDCPDQEEIQLIIKGRLGKAYVFDPPSQNLGDIYSTQETTVSVTLYSLQESPLKLSGGQVQDVVLAKKISVEVGEEKHLKPGELPHMADARHVVETKIKLSPGLPAGTLNLPIRFVREEFSGPEQNLEFLEYSVRARVITPVRVIAGDDYNETRNILDLGNARTSQGLKKKIMLAVRREDSDGDPNLRVASTFPSQLKATIGEPNVSANQRIYTITLEVPPGSEPVEFDGTFSKDFGKIVFKTDMESSPEIPMYLKLKVSE